MTQNTPVRRAIYIQEIPPNEAAARPKSSGLWYQ